MPISITARHEETDSLKTYAETKAKEITEAFPEIERLHVIMDKQKHNYMVEIVLQAKKRFKAEATDITDDLRKSIDQAFEKIERQLRKHSEKIHDHRE